MAEMMDTTMDTTMNTEMVAQDEPDVAETVVDNDTYDVAESNPLWGIVGGIVKKVAIPAAVGAGCWAINKVRKSSKKHIERPVEPVGDVLVGRRSDNNKKK